MISISPISFAAHFAPEIMHNVEEAFDVYKETGRADFAFQLMNLAHTSMQVAKAHYLTNFRYEQLTVFVQFCDQIETTISEFVSAICNEYPLDDSQEHLAEARDFFMELSRS